MKKRKRRYTVREVAILRGCNLRTVYRALWAGTLQAERNPSGRYWYVPEESALDWVSRPMRTWSRAPGYRAPDKRIALGRVRVRVSPGVWRETHMPNAQELRGVATSGRTPSEGGTNDAT